jgi:hypothetical protein
MHTLLLLLTACGVNEDNFADKFGHLLCSLSEECYEEDFDDAYDDFEDCLDDTTRLMEDVQDYAESLCAIDYDIASECYADMKAMSCEEFEDGQETPSCSDYVVCD